MTQNAKIPFVDLVSAHRDLQAELLEVCKRVIQTAGFIGGPEVEGFEKEFAEYCETKYCVAVNSGTDALRFALIAAGVRPGDIVITVPNTFFATAEAISQAGARVDFVDIDERTFNMDPAELRRYFEMRCRFDSAAGRYVHRATGRPVTAVVPVHLYGQMADMDAIVEIAEEHCLTIVEDACQAHGAQYFSKKRDCWVTAGSVGRAAAFSFYPGKNLGACGEGGAITSNDQELAKKCAMLRDHGMAKKYFHDIEGYNGRLDSIQAGMLRVKLKHLTRWNEERRKSVQIYSEILASMEQDIVLPFEASSSRSAYHLYVIRTTSRNELQKHLTEAGIGTGIHYPIPVHLQKAYSTMGWKLGDFPKAERAADEVLSLPMFPGLTREQQENVRDAVAKFTAVEALK